VLCEKPLATTSVEAWRVVEAEAALGRQLLQVGFMRRFDPGYLELKHALTSGLIGDAVIVHNLHRNPSSATSATDAGIVTGSMIHELDIAPWLLDSPVRSIRIESPRSTGLKDPQLAWIHHESGAMSTVEVFVNAAYGYDVRCEVVATEGVAELPVRPAVGLRTHGQDARAIRPDFVAHFADAYRRQMASWVNQVVDGVLTGPSAWDGFVATAVAEAGVASLALGTEQAVTLPERPELYRREQVLA
jgi:myo-inositol 2-dehydrogenase/D-chiro-inositol 1-dehydrogenase